MTKLNLAHVQWCKNLFDHMAEGGVWGIPRSGLVFQRRGNDLVLMERMNAPELRQQQADDLQGCIDHFKMFGVTVRDETQRKNP